MPTDQLTTTSPDTSASPRTLVDAVLAVLSGTPLQIVSTKLGVMAADLAEAIDLYQAAGQAALEAQAADRDWYQVRIQFPDWDTAERVGAAVLGPRLRRLQDRGVVTAWWFIRKYPCWRIRFRIGADSTPGEMTTALNAVLDGLTVSGEISRWWQSLYEPETAAFGGPPAMGIAHELFCADSDHMLRYLQRSDPPIGRREVSMLLCTALLRAARLDWFECGDVWHRIAALRPLPNSAPAGRLSGLAATLRTLVNAPTHPTGALFAADQPLAFARPWAEAVNHAGDSLGEAAAAGQLDRGIRNVLAHLVIFHWNRFGLPATTQGVLAHAATEAFLPRR